MPGMRAAGEEVKSMKSATIQERYLTVIEEFILCPYCGKEIKIGPLPKGYTGKDIQRIKCWWCKKFFKVKPNPEDAWNKNEKVTK
jgi:hypothetical protein